MKRINIDTVKPGDIIFTARPGKISKAIRLATDGIVSHAMICVQHGSFIDSTSDGVQARNFQRELFDDDEGIFHFRLKDEISQEKLATIIDFARSEIGARYSIFEATRSVTSISSPRSKRQFCSRLVARVYKKAGIDLVPDADYCSPEDLRRSPLLVEIPVQTETVSDQELAWSIGQPNLISEMHKAQNEVLSVARSFDDSVENFDDIYALLVKRSDVDRKISESLRDSGYLEVWRNELSTHPWRYSVELINEITEPRKKVQLKEYCIGTVKEAYSGGFRFSSNLVQFRRLHNEYPRKSFQLEIGLYEILVKNDEARREVAYEWLSKNDASALRHHMEQIEPHSPYWHSMVDRVEPNLAARSRHAVDAEGHSDVCSSCGDQPAKDYRVLNGAQAMPGVPSLRLCEDCHQIRQEMNTDLLPFLE